MSVGKKTDGPGTAGTSVLAMAGMAVAVGVLWGVIMFFSRASVNSDMIHTALREYEIVAKTGDAFEKGMRAGVVAEAYLMAGKEKEYADWKRISDNWNKAAMGGLEP
jgi:hypothetical protein